ncbi:MAG TPA: hypothetical protein VN931_07235 [Fibrobacteria bacterium]|nr:hypothetical protein [Fibrobacteria bacterium]
MPGKMRPISIAAASLGAVLALFVGWRAFHFFPAALERFQNHPRTTTSSGRIDSSLFDQELTGSDELEPARRNQSLDSSLTRLRDTLGIFRSRISAVRMEGADIPLYSLEFRRGVPLVVRVRAILDTLRVRGFLVAESSERPRAIWPWAMRVQRGDTLVALLRGRVSGDPLPGTFSLHLGFEQPPGSRIPSLRKLPRGTLLALLPSAYADRELDAELDSGGWVPALEVRLETSRDPVSLQKDRILLQHVRSDLRERLLPSDSCRTIPRGMVVSDGDRGSSDSVLSRRVVEFAVERGWWIMDATGNSASRLPDQAVFAGSGTLDPPRRSAETTSEALEAAAEQAVEEGESSLLLPLDSATIHKVVAYLPLLVRRGVVVAPWNVVHRKARRD